MKNLILLVSAFMLAAVSARAVEPEVEDQQVYAGEVGTVNIAFPSGGQVYGQIVNDSTKGCWSLAWGTSRYSTGTVVYTWCDTGSSTFTGTGYFTGSLTASSITGTVNGSNLVVGSVDSTKIVAGSIDSTRLANGLIDSTKMKGGTTDTGRGMCWHSNGSSGRMTGAVQADGTVACGTY